MFEHLSFFLLHVWSFCSLLFIFLLVIKTLMSCINCPIRILLVKGNLSWICPTIYCLGHYGKLYFWSYGNVQQAYHCIISIDLFFQKNMNCMNCHRKWVFVNSLITGSLKIIGSFFFNVSLFIRRCWLLCRIDIIFILFACLHKVQLFIGSRKKFKCNSI